MAKPTIEEIKAIVTVLEGKWSAAHANMEKWETWAIEGASVSRIPDGYQTFKQPLNYIIKGAVAQLITHLPKVTVKPSRLGQTGDDLAEKAKLLIDTALTWMDKENRASVAKELARNGLVKGLSILRGPIFNADAWGTEPERKDYDSQAEFEDAQQEYQAVQETCFPWQFQAVNPETAFPFSSGKGIVIKYQREVGDIAESFPAWDKGIKGNADEIEWVEYYDGKWRCFLADGAPVLKGNGVLPCSVVPYQWVYSTFGDNSRGAKPEDRAVGILANLDNTLMHLNDLMTAFLADIGNRVYGKYKEIEGEVKWPTEGGGPGQSVTVMRAESLTELRQPAIPSDFTLALGYLGSIVETNTYAQALLGLTQAPTATQGGMTLAQARLVFAPFLHNIESLLTEGMVKLAYEFRDSPYISSIRAGRVVIKQDDIKQPILLGVDLLPVDPEQDDRLQAAGMEHIKLRSLSRKTVIVDFFRKDPDIEEREIIKEGVLSSPSIIEVVIGMAIEKATRQVELSRAKELAKGITMPPGEIPPGQQPAPGAGQANTQSLTEADIFARQKMQGRIQPGGRVPEGTLGTSPEQTVGAV